MTRRMGAALSGWLGPDGAAALALSLKVAFWATLVSLPPGLICALTLARGRFWGRGRDMSVIWRERRSCRCFRRSARLTPIIFRARSRPYTLC